MQAKITKPWCNNEVVNLDYMILIFLLLASVVCASLCVAGSVRNKAAVCAVQTLLKTTSFFTSTAWETRSKS